MLRFANQETDRGIVKTVGRDSRSESFLIADNLPDSAKAPAKSISDIFDDMAEKAPGLNADLTSVGLTAKLKSSVMTSLPKYYTALIAAGVTAEQQANRLDHEMSDPGAPTPLDPLIITHALSMPFPDRITFVQAADRPQLAALMRAGPEIVMPESRDPNVWVDTVVNRYRAMMVSERYATQANHAGKPTLDNPLAAAKPDLAGAEANAQKWLDNAQKQREAIANLKQLIQRIAVMVAVMCDVTPEQAFAALQGGKPL